MFSRCRPVDSGKVKRRRVLGPAWVKPGARRSSRGATVWRAADGSCPVAHLTPKAAAAVLEEILDGERAKAATPSWARNKTTGEATAAFLGHAATVGGRRGAIAPSTLRGYESV